MVNVRLDGSRSPSRARSPPSLAVCDESIARPLPADCRFGPGKLTVHEIRPVSVFGILRNLGPPDSRRGPDSTSPVPSFISHRHVPTQRQLGVDAARTVGLTGPVFAWANHIGDHRMTPLPWRVGCSVISVSHSRTTRHQMASSATATIRGRANRDSSRRAPINVSGGLQGLLDSAPRTPVWFSGQCGFL